MKSLRPPMGMFTRDVPFVLYHAAYGGAEYSGDLAVLLLLRPTPDRTHHWGRYHPAGGGMGLGRPS